MLRWVLLILLLALGTGCESGIATSLDGKACDEQGRCVPGYVCDGPTQQCVRVGEGTAPSSTSGDGSCTSEEATCNGACVDTRSNAQNCGGCGATCSAPPNGAGICLDGSCNFACNKPFSPCGSSCLDLANDVTNCGACGHACPEAAAGKAACVQGACTISCELPLQACGTACVDVGLNPAHCGACDLACAPGKVCSEGACSDSCVDGKVNCGGACVDLKTSPQNCGA
jgi:hypothetical protein